MKTRHYFTFVILISTLLGSCTEPSDRQWVLININNQTGELDCSEGLSLKFVFYLNQEHAKSGGVILKERSSGPMHLSVEDGERIYMEVIREGDDALLANAHVQIWTERRAANVENETRTITYCTGEEISFEFF